MNEESWRLHLAGTDKPFIHILPPELLHLNRISNASRELGFVLFEIDARAIVTVPTLMDAFADAMNFPAYFGRNWDALRDCMTDLSWYKASGYALVLSYADSLSIFGQEDFSAVLGVIEAAVTNWRDERWEYMERTRPVPFHVIFSGDQVLRETLLAGFSETVCEHESESSVRIAPIAARLRGSQEFRDAGRLIQAGAELETLLAYMRERGMDKLESMYAVAALTGKHIYEAKEQVDNSRVWSDYSDEHFRNLARRALRDLGYDDKT